MMSRCSCSEADLGTKDFDGGGVGKIENKAGKDLSPPSYAD